MKNFGFKKKVSVSVLKKFGIEKSIGFGFVKCCIEKIIAIGKKLVSKKVLDSVSKIFGIGKKLSVSFRFWVSSQTVHEDSI